MKEVEAPKRKISWAALLRALPGTKRAVDGLVGPGASSSRTVWYNLCKAAITILSACGVWLAVSEEELQTVAATLALVVPAVGAGLDAFANIWLRKRTVEPLNAKAENS